MTLHSYHPDSHVGGLVDGCERCAEHAANPFYSLDDNNLWQLVERLEEHQEARSENEALAMSKVAEVLQSHRRISQIWLTKGMLVMVEASDPRSDTSLTSPEEGSLENPTQEETQ